MFDASFGYVSRALFSFFFGSPGSRGLYMDQGSFSFYLGYMGKTRIFFGLGRDLLWFLRHILIFERSGFFLLVGTIDRYPDWALYFPVDRLFYIFLSRH